MRRPLALLLALLFALGPLAPAFGSDDANLPACCRRHGTHHCAMSAAARAWMAKVERRTPGWTAPSTCPLYPTGSGAVSAPSHALAVETETVVALAVRRFAVAAKTTLAAASPVRSHAVRGPPLPAQS